MLPSAVKMATIPTRYGVMLATLLVLMFIWSANHQLNLGYALTFLVAVLVMFAAGLTANELANLHVRCRQPPPVFAGENAIFPLELVDPQGRSRGSMQLRCGDGEVVTVAGIDAGEAVTANLLLPALARGWLPLPLVTLETRLPLGWFYSWQWLYLDAQALIYPLPAGDLPLPYAPVAERGDATYTVRGEEELSGLTAYRYGDPLSRVAWKRSSNGVLYVKQFSGQGSQRVSLDMAALRGDVETRLSQLAKWVVEAEAQGLTYSLQLDGQYIAHNRGDAHYHRCLRALALY